MRRVHRLTKNNDLARTRAHRVSGKCAEHQSNDQNYVLPKNRITLFAKPSTDQLHEPSHVLLQHVSRHTPLSRLGGTTLTLLFAAIQETKQHKLKYLHDMQTSAAQVLFCLKFYKCFTSVMAPEGTRPPGVLRWPGIANSAAATALV